MAWKRYSDMSPTEKALRNAKKKAGSFKMSPEGAKRMREQKNRPTTSTDWS